MMITAIEKETAERFRRDTAKHVMTVLHDDGLYRHLRFQEPGRSGYWFDIVTWPGSLAIRGDMDGCYVFSRTTDMFEFFRHNGNDYRINPGYWAEKLPDYGKSVKIYSEDMLRANLEPHLVEYEQEQYPDLLAEYEEAKACWDATPLMQRWPRGSVKEPEEPKSPEGIRRLIAEYDHDGLLTADEGARALLRDLEGHGLVSDTWEWSLVDWDWSYLWACHAVVWGIARYGGVEMPAVSASEPAAVAASAPPRVVTVELAGVSK